MTYFTVTSEWDIGLEGKRYSSIEVARAHVEEAFVDTGMEDITVAEAEDEGLISYEEHGNQQVISTLPHRYSIVKEDNDAPAAEVVNLTDDDFEQFVKYSELPVLVDFWAPWCGPCKMLAPIMKDLAQEYDGQLVVAKMNCDKSTMPASIGIRGIPALIVYKNGVEVARRIGNASKEVIQSFIHGHIYDEE